MRCIIFKVGRCDSTMQVSALNQNYNKSRDKADVNKRISDADEHQFECH